MELRGAAAGSVYVGGARLDVHIPGAGSLKNKRKVMHRLRANLENDLGASVAEVGYQDLWQRAAIGIAIAATSAASAEHVLERIIRTVEKDSRVIVTSLVTEIDEIAL